MSILEALGVAEFPAPDSLKKLLEDSYVQLKCAEVMVEEYAARAISRMHPEARASLLKRISPPRKPLHKVSWNVAGGTYSGKIHIMGSCGQCNQTCHFDGKPEDAKTVTWNHCLLGPSCVPESVVKEYAAKFGYQA
jgi:hypothetical protein